MNYKITFAVISLTINMAYSQAIDKTVQISKEVLGYIQQGKSAQAIPYFDETMKKSLTASQLDEGWVNLNKQLGGFLSTGETTTGRIQEYKVVYILCLFKNDKLKFKAVFNKENKISGLFFIPANQK